MSAAPGGQRTDIKRRNNAKAKAQAQSQTPTSTRSAGFGGSSASLLKLYTDEAQGLRVDPLIVMFLAVGFIFSVIALHIVAKLTGKLL
ncbi:SEC61-beta family protein, partial [Cyberlindnera jadinii NRRL Y-1542]